MARLHLHLSIRNYVPLSPPLLTCWRTGSQTALFPARPAGEQPIQDWLGKSV